MTPYSSSRPLRGRKPKTCDCCKIREELVFQAVVPRLWNALPLSLRQIHSVKCLKIQTFIRQSFLLVFTVTKSLFYFVGDNCSNSLFRLHLMLPFTILKHLTAIETNIYVLDRIETENVSIKTGKQMLPVHENV